MSRLPLNNDPPLVICIAEDRRSCEPAIRLLLVSLSLRSTNISVTLFYPQASEEFLRWIEQFISLKVTVRTTPVAGAYGWNVKPQALLLMLSEGHQQVVWIDSDIITTKDIGPVFLNLDKEELLITEDALIGHNEIGGVRARAWGLPIGRTFQFPLNTGVMRVTQRHLQLLCSWKTILESAEYRNAQKKPWNERPIHMISDQDVLTALLSSREFSGIPLKILRRGWDIIQYFGPTGFTLTERLICATKGMPAFVHTQGWKPWSKDTDKKPYDLRSKLETIYRDLSPYILLAKAMSAAPPPRWTRQRFHLGSCLEFLGFGYAPLTGLPLALLFDLQRLRRLPKQTTKRLLQRYYPAAIADIRDKRNANHMRRHFRDVFLARQNQVKVKLYGPQQPVVLSGPFAGLKYLNEIVWGPIEPKWLGTYEEELHTVMQRIFEKDYSTIFDVGSAEGYYAVGLAKQFPSSRVYSYDIDPFARAQQRRLARLNHVSNIIIKKRCTSAELNGHIAGRTLLVCDAEGFEYELLDPSHIASLRECDILVELHDSAVSGYTVKSGAEELSRRFGASHEIERCSAVPRREAFAGTLGRGKLTAEELVELANEHRPADQLWLWLEARERR